MSDQFKTKVQEFTDSFKDRNIAKESPSHAYRDKKQTCERGEKQIDPETGLIYFKYDFGYEFGIVTSKKSGEIQYTDEGLSKRNSLFDQMTGDVRPTVGSQVKVFDFY
jgi:hypothetical protein